MTNTTQNDEFNSDLKDLDSSDPVKRAISREKAQEIIASPEIDLEQREAIADRLIEANQALTAQNVGKGDSY